VEGADPGPKLAIINARRIHALAQSGLGLYENTAQPTLSPQVHSVLRRQEKHVQGRHCSHQIYLRNEKSRPGGAPATALLPVGLLFAQPSPDGGCCSFSLPIYLSFISLRLLLLKGNG